LDAHIPMSDVETIKSKQPSVEVYTYNADHGFQCDERDSFAAEAEPSPLQRSFENQIQLVSTKPLNSLSPMRDPSVE
jgi:hypothetical protein